MTMPVGGVPRTDEQLVNGPGLGSGQLSAGSPSASWQIMFLLPCLTQRQSGTSPRETWLEVLSVEMQSASRCMSGSNPAFDWTSRPRSYTHRPMMQLYSSEQVFIASQDPPMGSMTFPVESIISCCSS